MRTIAAWKLYPRLSAVFPGKSALSRLQYNIHSFTTAKCRKICSSYTLLSVSSCTVSTQESPKSEDSAGDTLDIRRYTVADFQHLVTDKLTKERIRTLLRHHKIRLRHGLPTPIQLTSEDIISLLAQPSHIKKCRLFEYLFYKEKKRFRQIGREMHSNPVVREQKSRKPAFVPHTADCMDDYRLFGNTIFVRIQETAINMFYESRQIPAVLFGQSLVFDLGFDKDMTPRECNKAAVDLRKAYSRNRFNRDPFQLYFCNASPNRMTTRLLNESLFEISKHTSLSEVTERSYLDLFPRDKLVYLTPDGRETLDVFDHDAVYVIGVLVDKEEKVGATLAKAETEGLRTARFPQVFTLQWEATKPKALHLTDVLKVLLALKRFNDWSYALKFINRSWVVS